ncbi:MAG TPA: isocitrate lyase/PEP mutase family protein [Candidatus Binatia bacterium]|jgi:2-methylisocitrate lyase-like PEP mutase family enzyme|nr:isocitrate lyase/PEP mutase family protein [Candidatus Binatia bacterium]
MRSWRGSPRTPVFKAIYLSGGSLGWLKCVTEANLTLPEMAQVAVELRSVCKLPIVLDAGGGWGDPAHMHRTIALSEAADSTRSSSKISCFHGDSTITSASNTWFHRNIMVSKIREAVGARSDPDFLIIGRTNARRRHDMDETLRRAEAYHKAGADMLFVHTRNPDEMRVIGERLPPPLMIFAPEDGFAEFPLSPADLAGLGFRLAASSGSAFAAMYKAVRSSYESLARGTIDPLLGRGGAASEMKAAQKTARLERLLEVEKRTIG